MSKNNTLSYYNYTILSTITQEGATPSLQTYNYPLKDHRNFYGLLIWRVIEFSIATLKRHPKEEVDHETDERADRGVKKDHDKQENEQAELLHHHLRLRGNRKYRI